MKNKKFTDEQVVSVSDFLQSYMLENNISEMTADECANILDTVGILIKTPPKPGFNFRQMLRDGRDGEIKMVEGVSQEAKNKKWKIKKISPTNN